MGGGLGVRFVKRVRGLRATSAAMYNVIMAADVGGRAAGGCDGCSLMGLGWLGSVWQSSTSWNRSWGAN